MRLIVLTICAATTGCEIAAYVDRSELSVTSDGGEAGVECSSPSDCPAPQQECFAATCNAGKCGTQPAPYQQTCSTGQCDGIGKCLPPSCIDHTKDGLESDVDCGGALCPPCADYMTCTQNSDCMSN